MRELAVRSGNENPSVSDRTNANLEYTQLLQEIDVATTTSFNGNNLLECNHRPHVPGWVSKPEYEPDHDSDRWYAHRQSRLDHFNR